MQSTYHRSDIDTRSVELLVAAKRNGVVDGVRQLNKLRLVFKHPPQREQLPVQLWKLGPDHATEVGRIGLTLLQSYLPLYDLALCDVEQ